ncbi:MAG: hypothetical protein LC099_03860 [Anaerolineales bacterium]|nr:hypothetical protein [Anaerolineales bacterium]
MTHNQEEKILSARKKIFFWGAASAFVYLLFVVVFPLFPHIYREGAMLDLELILRGKNYLLVWVYIVGLLILFFAFWQIMRIALRVSKEAPERVADLRKPIFRAALLCGFILLWLYPITALDVAVYVVNARNWVLRGGNPLTVPPSQFPDDPYSHLAGEYATKTSPYGPAWEALAAIPIRMGVDDIGGGIVAMKIISLLAFAGTAYLLGWHSPAQAETSANGIVALAFFAFNPLVLLEALGNGHNDMTMIALMTLSLVLWQRGRWAWATLALTVAALTKLSAIVLFPLFGLAVLMDAPNWKERLLRGVGIAAIFLVVFFSLYRLMGPFPDVFSGILASFSRRSFSPAYALHLIAREFSPALGGQILPNTRYVFLLVYLWIAVRLLRRKIEFLEAGFLAYLALIFLSNAFRIWYPLWLVPFAALRLTNKTFWRTFIFSLTSEFSILAYYVLWRWYWKDWAWGKNGPLAAYWDYYKIMTPFVVSWQFSLPFLGDLVGKLRDKNYAKKLWI